MKAPPLSLADLTWYRPLMPSEKDDPPVDLSVVRVFGPFQPGEHVTIAFDAECNVNARSLPTVPTVAELRARHAIGAGVWRFELPIVPGGDGSVYVAIVVADQADACEGWCVRGIHGGGSVVP